MQQALQGEIVRLGTQTFGFIHKDGEAYHFYFTEVTRIESDGQCADLSPGAVTPMKDAQGVVTLRVGDKVRFHPQPHPKGKSATKMT